MDVPAGAGDGYTVMFVGAGDELNGEEQDVEVVIKEEHHSIFARNGADLSTRMSIPLIESLCGLDTTITGIDGKPIKIIQRDVRPGDTMVIKEGGMPIQHTRGSQVETKNGERGNLTVIFNIVFPPPLSDDQRKKVKKAMS